MPQPCRKIFCKPWGRMPDSVRFSLVLAWGFFQLVPWGYALPGGAPEGNGEVRVGEGDRVIQVFTYKPKGFSSGPIFFMFHGAKRKRRIIETGPFRWRKNMMP